jgi:hypothetical protein
LNPFKAGDRVYYNDPSSAVFHGKYATVAVSDSEDNDTVLVQFDKPPYPEEGENRDWYGIYLVGVAKLEPLPVDVPGSLSGPDFRAEEEEMEKQTEYLVMDENEFILYRGTDYGKAYEEAYSFTISTGMNTTIFEYVIELQLHRVPTVREFKRH